MSERRNLLERQNVSERQKRVAIHPLFTEVYDLNNIFELLSGDFCSYYTLFSFSLSFFIFILFLFLMFIISLTCVLVTYLRFPLSPSLSPPPIASKTSVNQRRLQQQNQHKSKTSVNQRRLQQQNQHKSKTSVSQRRHQQQNQHKFKSSIK